MRRWGWLGGVICLGLLWEGILLTPQWHAVRAPETSLSGADYLYRHLIPGLPAADRFDFPIRPPDGEGSYLRRSFGENHEVGESWAVEPGRGEGAEPVFACADGLVLLADNLMSEWGHVVIVAHRLPEGGDFPAVETLYAGMDRLEVVAGDLIQRGQRLGTLPAGGGACLRLELRTQAGMGLGPGAAVQQDGWTAPTPFIRAHRR